MRKNGQLPLVVPKPDVNDSSTTTIMRDDCRVKIIEKRGEKETDLLQTVLQTAPARPPRMVLYGGGSFIFGVISAVSGLIISVGVFYVLIKLGGFLDGMKIEAGSAKK